jgi:hypothetical protein
MFTFLLRLYLTPTPTGNKAPCCHRVCGRGMPPNPVLLYPGTEIHLLSLVIGVGIVIKNPDAKGDIGRKPMMLAARKIFEEIKSPCTASLPRYWY